MTVDLNIDPVYIIDRIRWHFEVPFQDAIKAIIREYEAARNLYPVKIIILGPPASGKTIVARYLADHYGIHYIHVKSLISETIQNLVSDKYLQIHMYMVSHKYFADNSCVIINYYYSQL